MLGEKIKEIRIRNNLSQEEFGKRFFHNKSTVSKWEQNKQTPNLSIIKKISIMFGVDLNELIDDNEVNRKKVIANKELLTWEKASSDSFVENPHKFLLRKYWYALVIILVCVGAGLFIPLFVAQDAYTTKEVKLLLAGTLLIVVATILWGVVFRIYRSKAVRKKYNASCTFWTNQISIKSKFSSVTTTFVWNEVDEIDHIGDNNVMDITIKMINDVKVKLYDVDNSVLKMLNKKKGGKNE